MFKAGEVYLNPVTGERAVIRIGTDMTGGERMVVDVYAQPGGRVMGEHIHPEMEERFVMLRGKVGFRLAWGVDRGAWGRTDFRRELPTTGETPERRKHWFAWKCGRQPGLRP